jgi:hypothetical protein
VSDIYIPPKINPRGNWQVWFVETGDDTVDGVVNGFLLGLIVFTPFIAFL